MPNIPSSSIFIEDRTFSIFSLLYFSGWNERFCINTSSYNHHRGIICICPSVIDLRNPERAEPASFNVVNGMLSSGLASHLSSA